MEAEERPSKLRKLSHDFNTSSTPSEAGVPLLHGESNPAQTVEVETAKDLIAKADNSNTSNSLADTSNPTENASISVEADQTSSLSKNQLKKLAKAARWEAGREDRKVKRKQKMKEKKERRRDAQQQNNDQPRPSKPLRSSHKRRVRFPVAFVIDCGFDSLMVENEIISLGSQIHRIYSDNNKVWCRAHLYVSGWKLETRLRQRFEGLLKGMYRNWKDIVFVEEGFMKAARMAEEAMKKEADRKAKKDWWATGAFEKYKLPTGSGGTRVAAAEKLDKTNTEKQTNGDHTDKVSTTSPSAETTDPYQTLKSTPDIVYLTSDSPSTLTDLKPFHTYVIGGLVDKNRHKGICYKTALDANATIPAGTSPSPEEPHTSHRPGQKQLQTAKLPIGEFMRMTSRQVLTTNHVVEIMLRWLENGGDWGSAFVEVLPKRKGAKLRGGAEEENTKIDGLGNGNGKVEEEEEEDADDDDNDNEDDDGDAGDGLPVEEVVEDVPDRPDQLAGEDESTEKE